MEEKTLLPLQGRSLPIQLGALILLIFMGMSIGSTMGFFTISNLFGVDAYTDSFSIETLEPGAYKVLQSFYTLGTYLLPALVFMQLSTRKPEKFLGNRKVSPIVFLTSFLLIVGASFVVDGLVYATYNFPYPSSIASFMESMASIQEANADRINQLLVMESTEELLLNLLIMAVLPAISEEFLFRGTIQQVLFKHWRNEHSAIWFTAIMFAILHQSFFYLPGLLFLGAILGYVRQWTGNIWLSVLLHFINNGSLVLIFYYAPQVISEEGAELNYFTVFGGAVLTTLALSTLYRYRNKT